MLNKKIKPKLLSLLLAGLLTLNPMVVPFVWAEETSGIPSEAPVEVTSVVSEPAPSEDPVVSTASVDPQPTVAPSGDSTTVTGDASSQTQVETTVNTHQDSVSGSITTSSGDCSIPQVTTECPGDVNIQTDNQAEVTDTTQSEATTGDNSTTGSSGDALIDSGNALAGASVENEINTNTVEFQGSGQETVQSTPAPGVEITIQNENDATVINQATVSGQTGQNEITGSQGDATIDSGDAVAWANLLNFLNTNVVGSEFELFFLDLLQGQSQDVDLNQLWQKILAGEGGELLSLASEEDYLALQLLFQNQNQASLTNEVDVTAGSGGNQALENGGDASVNSGDATAMANVTNFVNTNLLGTKFFFGVINIFGDFQGNLIFPRPELFALTGNSVSGSNSNLLFENQNQAEVTSDVGTSADTGQNAEINNAGNNLIQTGNANAITNTFSLVNLNLFGNNWFFLVVNDLGGWLGQVLGWSSPAASEDQSQASQLYEIKNEQGNPSEGQLQLEEEIPLLAFLNQNQANVNNDIDVTASTGQNEVSGNGGNASIRTGNAWALANLFNFINTNIIGGRFFFGLVNVIGDWGGDAIFAYPDVAISLSDGTVDLKPGDIFNYTLSFKNQGYDLAEGVVVNFELPEGLVFLSDSSGVTPSSSEGRFYSWSVANLEKGQEGSFTIQVQIKPDLSREEKLSLLERIIPQAYAEGDSTTVIASASIGTSDLESDTGNNQATVETLVYFPVEQTSPSSELPVLEISAKNNVGDFVYPGDTVTFEITVKNTGPVPAYNVVLTQKLINGVPGNFGQARFELGTLEPGRGGRLSFGLSLSKNSQKLTPGFYYTKAQAFGYSEAGKTVSSNVAKTDFEIRGREVASLLATQVVAKEEPEGEVLGATQQGPQNQEDVLPYVLLFLLSSLWLSQRARRLLRPEMEARS